MRCKECDSRVTLGIVSAKQETKTEKTYGDKVKTIGERVNVRLGLTCDCTQWRGHSLTYDGLDDGYFDQHPDKFPTQWIENYYEAE